MFKKALVASLVGLVFVATFAFGGQLEDWINRNMITPVLQGYATASLPTVGVRGHLAFDTTLGAPTVDDGTVWAPLTTRNLARIASHLEVNGTAPTVSSCTGGSVQTGSSDTIGNITGITGTVCTVLFNNNYVNTPFALVSRTSTTGGTGDLRAIAFTTGIDVFGLVDTSSFSYLTVGYY